MTYSKYVRSCSMFSMFTEQAEMLVKLSIRKKVLTIGTSFTELSFSRESVGPPSLVVLKWFRQTEIM